MLWGWPGWVAERTDGRCTFPLFYPPEKMVGTEIGRAEMWGKDNPKKSLRSG